MAKCKKNINIPKYAFGASEINLLIGGVGNAATTALSETTSPAQGAFSGMASGASLGSTMGSVIPGIGTAIGGIVGGIGGAISGLFKGRKQRRERRRKQRIAEQEQFLLDLQQLNAAMSQDYYSDNGYNELSFANGGVVPNTLAYLDDGELIREPNGNIAEIPEEGKPQDSNLMSVPVGTQVLSDKIKVPGTNRTFAEEGKRIMKAKKYGNDKYALNSKMLNDMNNQIKYDLLIALQENTKKGKKKHIKKYATGTPYINDDLLDAAMPTYNGRFAYNNIGTSFKPATKTATQLGAEVALNKGKGLNVGNIVGNIASVGSSIAGAVSNLHAKPEKVSTFSYTPKFGPSEYNINPLLEDINKNNAIARYNQNKLGGAGLAYGIQSAVARDKAISQAYDMKNKAENEMARNNATAYNQWGQYDAEARHRAATENALNRAAADSIRRKGISQLSTIVPSFMKDLRLLDRDTALLEAMIPYLEHGMTASLIQQILKNFG